MHASFYVQSIDGTTHLQMDLMTKLCIATVVNVGKGRFALGVLSVKSYVICLQCFSFLSDE